jgi:hypothetical protein
MRYLAIRFRRRSARHASAATAHHRRIRGVALLGVLAGLAVVLAPAGSAKPPTAPIKLYDVCLASSPPTCDTSSLSASTANNLTFTITNENGSNTTLGSANLDAPAGFSLGGTPSVAVYDASGSPVGSATPTGSIVTLAGGVDELQLRNLNLSNGWYATASFTATASSACMATWGVAAKQSNDFKGSGNDFQLVKSGGLTSSVAGGCKLAFLYDPASAHPNTPISDTAYSQASAATNSTTAGPHYVTVVATDGTNVLTSVSGVTVTLSKSDGTFDTPPTNCPPCFSGNSVQLTNGYATFPTLQTNGTGSGFTLTASAGASSPFAPATSTPPFDVIADTTPCDPTVPCPLSGVDSGGNPLDIVASTNFTFLGLNPYTPPTSTSGGVTTVTTPGCQNLIPVSGTGFAEYDGRSGSGTLTITIYVDMKKIKAQYGQNTGQQFIPMCIGVRPVDRITHLAGSCSPPGASGAPTSWNPAGDGSGWEGDQIQPSSGKSVFTGYPAWSVCGSDGYQWGIVSSFQDGYDTNPPQNYPEVTAWSSTKIGNTTYREFTLSVPPGWDVKGIN